MKNDLILNNFRIEPADPGVLHAVFSRPPLNAFTTECYRELSEITRYVDTHQEIAALVLTSDQRHFSAGADRNQLKQDAEAGPQHIAARRVALRNAWSDFRNCAAPVVVGVNGGAVGMGAALAACADVIIAAQDAFFSIPEIDIGLVGGAKSLTRILPAAMVRVMALTGERLPASTMADLGAIHMVVENESLVVTARDTASRISEKGAKVARQWKEAFRLTESVGIPEGFMIESALNQELA